MMRHTFWHAQGKANDIAWLNEAEAAMKNDSWTSPMFVDGSCWEDSMRKEAATRLFRALAKNTSVSRVILQNACIDQSMDRVLTKAMEDKKNLRSLTLRNLTSSEHIQLNQDQTPDVYTVPSEIFESLSLETLNLAKTMLNGQSCCNLSKMIRESTSLHTLILDSVQTSSPRGLMSVLAAIIMSKSLTTLKLQNLDWTKQNIQRLLLALSFNRSITTLHLEGMSLSTNDASALAHFLKRNKTVTTLSLRKNHLDATAIRPLIVDGMLHNTSVQRLFLSRNPLGDESSACFAQLLHETTTLHELCLVKTKLTEVGSAIVARALARNQGLSKISLDGNGLEAFCGQVLVESLQTNLDLVHVMDRLCVLLAKRRQQEASIWGQVDVLLRANQAGRRTIIQSHNDHTATAILHIPMAKAANQPEVLFLLLREGLPRFVTQRGAGSTSFPPANGPCSTEEKTSFTYAPTKTHLSLQRHSYCPPIA